MERGGSGRGPGGGGEKEAADCRDRVMPGCSDDESFSVRVHAQSAVR